MSHAPAPSGVDDGDTLGQAIYERRWWILAVLNLSLVMVVLGNSVLNVALPTLVRELGATNSELQWIVDAYALVFGGLLLTMGAVGDRFGRKGALQLGLVIFGAASAISILATQAWHLIATRAVMGLGAALVMPATLSILVTVFPPEERGKAMGIWAGFAGLGGAIGPVVGGWLLEHFAWGSIFALNLPVVLLALAGGAWLVPTSRDPAQAKLDLPGAVLSTVALGALLFAIIEAPDRGWTSLSVLSSFALSAIAGLAFAWWETTTEEPMLDLGFFEDRGFSIGSLTVSLTFFGMFASMFVLTQFLQFVQGYTPLEAGIRTLPFAGGVILAAPQSDRFARWLGRPQAVALGLVLLGVSLLSFAYFQVDTSYVLMAPAFLLGGIGMGLAMAPATATIMEGVPQAKAGVGSAVNDTAREVGGALGVAVLGTILNDGYQSHLRDVLPSGLPARAREAILESIGAALAIARDVAGSQGANLAAAAKAAFVDAMAWSFLAAAAFMAISAAIVLWGLPGLGPRPASETAETPKPRTEAPGEATPANAGAALTTAEADAGQAREA